MNQPFDDPFFTKIAKVVRMARIFPSQNGRHISTSFSWVSCSVAVVVGCNSPQEFFFTNVSQKNMKE
jgi:hypothetical protein